MAIKDLTVRESLERIQKTDLRLHAFLALNPKALEEKVKENQSLSGVPIAVKDNFSTIGLPTTAASAVLKDYNSPYEATVVSKLKAAGAIIIGKTNLDAFAHGSSTETSDFGATANPWNLDFLPGGSSGGSAAAVASGQVRVALGSETAGSIRQPAAWCGVVGFKPTYGRVSRSGLIAMASSTDSPGPLAQTVAEAEIVYQVLAGFDPLDATTSRRPVEPPLTVDLKNMRIGLPKEYFRPESQLGINQTVMDGARVLEKLGAKLIEISLFDPKFAVSVYTIIQRSEVSSNLARFDGIRFGQTRDFFNQENKRRIMLGTYTLSAGYYDAYYRKAQEVRTLIIEDFNAAFEKVDLILGPTSPTTAIKKGSTQTGVMFGELADMLVEPSSIAGLPGINLPCGFLEDLPVGLQLIGRPWSESLILAAAKKYEEETGWHLHKPAGL